MDQTSEPMVETVETAPCGGGMIESLQPSLPVENEISTPKVPSEAIPSAENVTNEQSLTVEEEVDTREPRDPSIYVFSKILKHRKKNLLPERRYKVLWDGYPEEQASWVDEMDFVDDNARKMLRKYKERNNLMDYPVARSVLDESSSSRRPEAEIAALPSASGNVSSRQGRKTTRASPKPSPMVRRRKQRMIDADDDSEGGGV